MARRNPIVFIIILYVAFFLVMDFLLPVFLPRYGYYFSYFPIFFFFPFFWFGRRNYGRPRPTADQDNTSDKDQGEDYEYVNENVDEFGMPIHRRDSTIFYILGAIVIIVAIVVLFMRF
ncbi:hypothetical membrane protein [Thermoplasma acidophilum]|uniref:Hypothetical membrane protein n=1 Tax=Thermoplasma acidophilum (strain ATCC 25905 / DSM 1728 / JCM 9062 / NBRC 15155 / AMRC-C165) TaxID=273075 RepID=Q9HK49_THEAC|nr:hypothetical protein [Thermoplasma acidophilum]CAC11890.1 hypothetical membrane protein [Thermoplasma acidophilum]